ncbi:MAG: hypothetical protein HKO53_02805 [Gemmatimonadetes bacterium]|nr:hypothetical protein [Gemmatimonadota bacterium]
MARKPSADRIAELEEALLHTSAIALGMTGPGNTPEQCRGYSDACRDISTALYQHAKKIIDEAPEGA